MKDIPAIIERLAIRIAQTRAALREADAAGDDDRYCALLVDLDRMRTVLFKLRGQR